jgi:flagellar basal-body rod protein FlgF
MDHGLYMGVAAMRSAEKRMEALTANLANASSPAYKRQSSATRAFDVGVGEKKHREVAASSSTDFSQGLIERREDPMAMALEGGGFFAVETPTGEAYTRNGVFRLDDQGELLTGEGHPVAWSGARGRVQPTGEPVTIDGTGKVRQGSSELGALKLVDFADKSKLTIDRDGYWHAAPGQATQEPTAYVHQFAIERSNSESIDELVALIKVQRDFESASGVMRTIDQSYRRLNQTR